MKFRNQPNMNILDRYNLYISKDSFNSSLHYSFGFLSDYDFELYRGTNFLYGEKWNDDPFKETYFKTC